MNETSIVRKLMYPVSEYARVGEDDALHDALIALDRAQQHVRPAHQPHRAVLVERSPGVYVGLLDYRTILRALRPKQLSIALDEDMRRAGVSDDMVSTSLASMHFFQEDLPSLCDRACSVRIGELLISSPYSIDVDASLHELIELFIDAYVPSVLVTDGGEAVGVIRIADLFDEVKRTALGENDGTCAADDD